MATQYADVTDLTNLGCPEAALSSISTDRRNAALQAASGIVDSYVGTRFKLPLTAYGDELKQAVCSIAAWRLLSVRGLAPGNASAETLRDNHDDAMRWLRDVAAGKAVPAWPANADVNNFDPTNANQGEAYVVQPTPGDNPPNGDFDRNWVGTPQKPRSRGW